MDEQPGHLARGVRDVTRVPLTKDLVKDNVGSTVKNQANTDFKAISQAASVEASALYLDPSLQARVVSLPTATPDAVGKSKDPEVALKRAEDTGDGIATVGRGARLAEEMGKCPVRTPDNEGPAVFMSDPENYLADANRRKGRKRGSCCVQ